MKIALNYASICTDSRQQDSDDGYTSLNALDSLKTHSPVRRSPNTHHLSRRRRHRPHSTSSYEIADGNETSSSNTDDRTVVYGRVPRDLVDGMYRLKVKSTTASANTTTTYAVTAAGGEFMGNKHLVRKYRMKRKDADSLEKERRKSTSSDQEDVDAPSRRKTGTL
uniref:Uncharacterized protein n=2 Tax=Mesocestoides corti TaxID=53468 RepID=A0A5K3FZS7_MESCO